MELHILRSSGVKPVGSWSNGSPRTRKIFLFCLNLPLFLQISAFFHGFCPFFVEIVPFFLDCPPGLVKSLSLLLRSEFPGPIFDWIFDILLNVAIGLKHIEKT